ncbi:putative Zn-dependent protease DUF2268 [Novosphingobium sp. PhB165]|uniref:gliding motility protein GldB-related protein n=1 Tax=Novosphingobium sp. PhB165 TaxID=2485105 RepID=UPI001043A944|nr:DUF2268 domain-containing putative Zn-dependent protease [Novosphingobium sp. PhB165]TCM19883.1 putative Zn-dependent protease DUF2268 [Novosphingobium sp. PhB165]
MIRRLVAFALCLALPLSAVGAATPAPPQILTEDVDRFFRLYDAASGHPTAEQLDNDYLSPGTAGLHEIAKLRTVTGPRIAANIAAHPQVYEKARSCLAVLPAVKLRLAKAFAKLAALYPEARFPPVTFVIGRGRPVGLTDDSGVTMGLEALCSADFMDPNVEDRFVHTIAHEYGHIQQSAAQQALEPDAPGATVLAMSLMEGAGEFTAELISGGVGDYQHAAWTKGREAEIENAFLRDMDKTDLSAWMYNGVGDAAHPGDLGYWVGYRIIKAYYARAHDKKQALREIYAMRDPKAFLTESGWKPGMTIAG